MRPSRTGRAAAWWTRSSPCGPSASRRLAGWRPLSEPLDPRDGQLAAEPEAPLGVSVVALDEEPVLSAPAGQAREHEPAPELPAVEREHERAPAQIRLRAGALGGLPRAAVPHHDGPGAVAALGDDPLEVAILEGVVVHPHGEPLVGRVHRGPLRHRPRLEDPAQLEAEVPVQPRSLVLVDDEATSAPAYPGHAPPYAATGMPPKGTDRKSTRLN